MKSIVRIVVAALLATAIAVPAASPGAQAQASVCEASTESELAACIDIYNSASAGSETTIVLTDSINLEADLPLIDNNSTGATLVIDGGGHTLDGMDTAIVVLWQDDGDTLIRNITIANAFYSGVRVDGGTIALTNSTLFGHQEGANSRSPGGMVISNSTLFDNVVGILISGSPVVIENSTVAHNWMGIRGVAVAPRVQGSLISDNRGSRAASSGDCSLILINDLGGNAISDDTCSGAATPSLEGTVESELADNGCVSPCTQTLAISSTSPALDANTDCGAGMTDQRGVPRTAGKCDAGAFEAGDCEALYTVDTEQELTFAIDCYNNATTDTTIEFGDDIVLSGPSPFINNPAAAPPRLTIDGRGYTLDGNEADEDDNGVLLQLAGDTFVTSITVTGAGFGPGVRANDGALELANSLVTGNGTGVRISSPIEAIITNSTIVDNSQFGVVAGGDSSVLVENSTIADHVFGVLGQSGGTAQVRGSLIARNTGNSDCSITNFVDLGGNVFGDDTCSGAATMGVADSLGAALGDNGCLTPCTQTLELSSNSPAIDANDECVAGLFDQRGVARTAGACDAGAFEFGDIDADGDGFDGPLGDNSDCDDANPDVNPGAVDVPANGIDEDCNGSDAASTAECQGLPVTIDMNNNGGNGDGTPGDDVIMGTPGNDTINGFGGNDTICAEAGNDTIDGGDGADEIFGNTGNDIIYGGEQADTINGGGGHDTLFGENGWDRITGSTGDDEIWGGNGNDWIWAGPGIDDLDGGPGNDLLLGFDGDDFIRAGDGNDKMNGMNGNDDVEGGDGADQIWGGLGNDHLKGQGGFDWIWGRWGNDTIEGGYGNDRLYGEGSADLIHGGPGNDLINGGIGTDNLHGGSGNDTIEGNDQSDNLYGGNGNDTLNGGFGTDTCNGGFGTNTLTNC